MVGEALMAAAVDAAEDVRDPLEGLIEKTAADHGAARDALEQLKAFSQNIGHDNMPTTLCSYGPASPERQEEIIRTLGQPDATTHGNMATEIAMQVVAMMKK
jgi:hypothetical protein